MKNLTIRIFAVGLAGCLVVSGCATTDSNGQPLSAMERSTRECAASIVGGALLGALIGAAAGGRNSTGTGAAIGAGAGTALCAVLIAMNNEQDREHVRESEANAVRTGQTQTSTYYGKDGRQRSIQTTSEPAIVPASTSLKPTAPSAPEITGPCRKIHTQITVQNAGTANLDPDLVCRNSAGDYVVVSNKLTT